MQTIAVTKLNNAELKALAATSAYTITGAGGDIQEWVNGYNKLLQEQNIGVPKKWMTFTGKQMNECFNLVDTKRYENDVIFLAFPLDGLDVGKLAMFRLQMEDQWFDDIVANNAAHDDDSDSEDE